MENEKELSSPGTKLANAEQDAGEILSKIPKDLHHLTLDNLLPMISVLMAHVEDIKELTGEEKKALVMYSLDLMVNQMPFPENRVLAPVVDAIAPGAIEGIIKGSKYASNHIEELLRAQRETRLPMQVWKVKWPKITRPSIQKRSPPSIPKNQIPTMARPRTACMNMRYVKGANFCYRMV